MRASGSWLFTKINFTMKEGLSILSKMNVLYQAAHELSADTGMEFFGDKSCLGIKSASEDFFVNEFNQIADQSLQDAENDARELGITAGEYNLSKIFKTPKEIEVSLATQPTRDEYCNNLNHSKQTSTKNRTSQKSFDSIPQRLHKTNQKLCSSPNLSVSKS